MTARCWLNHLPLIAWLFVLAAIATPGRAEPTPLVVAAALDRAAIEPVLDAFRRAHPDIDLHYEEGSTRAVDARIADPDTPPDVVISSAMPAQMARINAGYAQRLDTPETRGWPASAKWRDAVFGFTFEPIVFAFRPDLIAPLAPPETHEQFYRLLSEHADALRGRVATYDPQASAVGYALYQADAGYTAQFWQLISAMGALGAVTENDTRAMIDGLAAGRYAIGYNLIGSYAMRYARAHPDIVIQVPRDYSLVLSRMLFVHRDTRHPQAATTFVDFVLSREGQHILANQTPLFSMREDVDGPFTAARLRAQVGDHLFPIPVDAALMAIADPLRHSAFMQRWRHEFAADPSRATGLGQ